MPKSKLSVTLDPNTLERARALVNVASVSELLDVALDRLIRSEEERRHVDGYVRLPVTDDFDGLAQAVRNSIRDDTDWEALYSDVE